MDKLSTHTAYNGLSDDEVLVSRQQHGKNVLTPPAKTSLWQQLREVCLHWIGMLSLSLVLVATVVAALLASSLGTAVWVMPLMAAVAASLILLVGFFGGFKDPLFRILITAFVMSMGIAVYEYECLDTDFTTFFEPTGIIVALLLATGVAYALEKANEKTFRVLNEVNDDTPVKVIRNGNTTEVPRRDIVVGDIVLLDTGEEVPADCRLLESIQLLVDESSLTGEPPINKGIGDHSSDNQTTYPADHILKGTIVMEGSCVAEVLRVGDATESGKVFEASQVRDTEATPLNHKLNRLATWITRASYSVAALVVVGRMIAYLYLEDDISLTTTDDWLQLLLYLLQTVMIAVTLIVVAVPEGLPMSVTLSLAFSMRSLMKEKALPRTMHACETMGAADVICTDKTGTLTQNSMQVAETCLDEDTDLELLAQLISVNSTAELDFSQPDSPHAIGNPTEGALLMWLHGQGFNYRDIRNSAAVTNRLPFSTENKYMTTTFRTSSHPTLMAVKGAPEIVMNLCNLTSQQRSELQATLAEFQHRALRTLAIAYGTTDQLHDLQWAGCFAIADPIRADVPAAVRACQEAGIEVKMVTGDTVGTALEIGRQVGIWHEGDDLSHTITGHEFAAASDAELLDRLSDIRIVSRARPADKSRLVRLLRQQGHVVAVTGDGTNDAPALNAANVGLSMGDGTAVAKEASDMTILDNAFSTIERTVLWGRSLYRNIQRFIMYQATINVVACLIVLIGAFTGTESPLTVTQMLWVNLIMDTFAAIALASLPPQQLVMRERPRSAAASIISRPMMHHILGVGITFTLLLLAMLITLQHSNISSIPNLFHPTLGSYDGLTPYELSLFFTTFVMLQFWNMFNARAFKTGHSSFHDLHHCRGFVLIAAIILLGQVAIVQFGGQMFNVTPLHLTDWLLIIALTSPVLWLGEFQRLLT
ncbi:MAG: calcium-translocating P-type ATPase, PMCA-type [Bacteroidaceae bacterium]|nr:calcium-translocating P-type ATPase, PMCA-type [Bacteroidaceae bacterium]